METMEQELIDAAIEIRRLLMPTINALRTRYDLSSARINLEGGWALICGDENAALKAEVLALEKDRERLRTLPDYVLSGKLYEDIPISCDFSSDARYVWPERMEKLEELSRAALEGK